MIEFIAVLVKLQPAKYTYHCYFVDHSHQYFYLDFCRSAVCDNGGTCVNHPTDFFCQCTRGFTGRHCQIIAPAELQDLVKLGELKCLLLINLVMII